MALTWQQFIDAVTARLSDAKPSEGMFTEAVAEYLRARIALELRGDKDGYALSQNRYTSLRRKLAGFATARSDTTLRADVRSLVAPVAPSDALFAVACSYWVQAHGVGAINRNVEEAGSWMAMYRQRRVELLGYTPSFANIAALRAAVEPLLISGFTENLPSYYETHLQTARSDLTGLAQWVDQQIAAAKADLAGLQEKVTKEIRSAVIGIQELIRMYQIGQTTTIAADSVAVDGLASAGILPEQAAIREAWMVFSRGGEVVRVTGAGSPAVNGDFYEADTFGGKPRFFRVGYENQDAGQIVYDFDRWILTADFPIGSPTVPRYIAISNAGHPADVEEWVVDDDAVAPLPVLTRVSAPRPKRVRCMQVPWEARYDLLTEAEAATPQIAIDPYAKSFIVAPALVEDASHLEIMWDGVRLNFSAGDSTPFDEGMAEAVALKVQAAMAPEFGDATAVAREFARLADERVGLLYVETLRRKRVQHPSP